MDVIEKLQDLKSIERNDGEAIKMTDWIKLLTLASFDIISVLSSISFSFCPRSQIACLALATSLVAPPLFP